MERAKMGVATGAFPALEAELKAYGWGGICPEAMEEYFERKEAGEYIPEAAIREAGKFMAGMRALLAPKGGW